MRSTDGLKMGEDGLSCEVTEIRAKNTNWWSIGFEGFGNKNNQGEFRYLLEGILEDFPIKLERYFSSSYPEWIRRNFPI